MLSARGSSQIIVPSLGPCLVWTGALGRNGYGSVKHEGKSWPVHRLAWRLEFGPIAEGVQILHRCDVRACFALAHLFPGDDAVNAMDREQKERGRTPLDQRAIEAIRAAIQRGEAQRSIARRFGVSQSTISHVNTGATHGWRV